MKNEFIQTCLFSMKKKNLLEEKYKKRFKVELQEVSNQNMFEYFLEAYHKKQKWHKNENNLLIAYLLDLVEDFDIDSPPVYEYGEFPDIDVDYLEIVRDYLKLEWAPKKFGQENICSIGTYTTFGLKSALIDMARVHGRSREEILSLTTKLGIKDDEGNSLTWEKALELNEDLAKYCKDNPDVAEAARILINRRRGSGTHAGGLVVSSSSINNLVPLFVGKDGSPVSAWTEGLHDQDLQPVGLIKFDLLVITDIYRIAMIVQLIKKRHDVEHINALPNQSDWTDTSYLNDPKALSLANISDTKGVFQFNSEGIRRLLRSGGVTSFDDLVAYSALYRPGCLRTGMDKHYCHRKRGIEELNLHPLMEPILGKTYGVMLFQEQVMKILHIIGGVPLKDCEIVRKAISKKKIEKFMPYKDLFLENGQKRLQWSKESVEELWGQIEAYSDYGFNKSHAVAYTYISSRLLWLKAHYPLEFYCVTLSLENDTEKIKNYMNDAKSHDIIIEPIDVNRSGVDFKIIDEDICYGFSKIKGMGSEVSKRIAENAPYKNFVDFMTRFGTDAKVIQPLIALGAFKDASKSTLHKFYEVFKDKVKKRKDRQKRFQSTMDKYKESLEGLLGDRAYEVWNSWKPSEKIEEEEVVDDLSEHFEEVKSIWKKWKRSVENFYRKERESDEDDFLSLERFNPNQYYLSEEFEEIYNNPEKAEEIYYGFKWSHPLERSDDYKGYTFELLNQELDLIKGPVQVLVIDYKSRTSKNNKTYYQLEVEDAHGERARINIWSSDHNRYGNKEFSPGNLLQLSVCPPQGGFKTYTMAPSSKISKWKPISKEDDVRVLLMHKPIEEEEFQPIEKSFEDVGLIEID